MTRLAPPVTPTLADADLERVRRELTAKLVELQKLPTWRALGKVSLVDGVVTLVPHKLGRRPLQVVVSPPRGPSTTGRIEEVQTGAHDLTKFVVLEANGFGATVAVDVAVLA